MNIGLDKNNNIINCSSQRGLIVGGTDVDDSLVPADFEENYWPGKWHFEGGLFSLSGVPDPAIEAARKNAEMSALAAQTESAAQIVFVTMAQAGSLDNAVIADHPALFVRWDADWRGKAGDIVNDENRLFKSLHDVTNAGQNTKPSATPSMWVEISDPAEEWPLIPNPIPAVNPWMTGQKGKTGDGRKWISAIDNNIWQPTEYPAGWTSAE